MMRVLDNGDSVVLWASASDTHDWAWKPGARWPCSTLANKRFCATFDTNGLLDLTVNGRYPNESMDIDSHELSAICADLLSEKIGADHPVYFVTIGQFK